MPYRTEILEACQDWGFKLGHNGPKGIIVYAGWATRGGSVFNPQGSVNHHTAGPRTGNLPSLATLLYGRPDVPGPLCNGALARNACINLLAAGKANHAGLGGWNGLSGNSTVWGLEVEHVGTTAEPVTDEMWDAMHRWHRACADVSGFPIANICQHFEWAPTRKVDFVKSITDPHRFRRDVAALTKGDDFMSALTDPEQRELLSKVRSIFNETAADGEECRLAETTIGVRNIQTTLATPVPEVKERPLGFFAKTATAVPTDTVSWVAADHTCRVSMPVGSPLHEHLKQVCRDAGWPERAQVLPDTVLNSIPLSHS